MVFYSGLLGARQFGSDVGVTAVCLVPKFPAGARRRPPWLRLEQAGARLFPELLAAPLPPKQVRGSPGGLLGFGSFAIMAHGTPKPFAWATGLYKRKWLRQEPPEEQVPRGRERLRAWASV